MEDNTIERLERSEGAESVTADREEKLQEKIWREMKKIWVVAGPAMFTKFSMYGVQVISQAFVGHIGPTELAAYSLVSTVLLRFVNGSMLGMASALETLCGQAYGAKQNEMLGIYLQRSWIVLTICAISLSPIFIFSTPIFIALGQDKAVAAMTQNIAYFFIPAMFAFLISNTCQMFLQAQSKNRVITYIAAFSLAVHLCLSWILVVKYKFGIIGAMISVNVAYWIPNIGQLIFIFCGGCPKTWTGFSFLAFRDLWPIIKLSMSSGIMICLEFWYNSILVLLTGNLKNAEVAINALAICLNINNWEMMVALGFLAAASVRVSNELGRGSSKATKFAIVTTVITSFAIGFLIFIVFLVIRGRVAYIFTKSNEVAKEVRDLSPLLATSILLNSIQPVLSGVAVGAGRQGIIAYVNIGCYYFVGIPIGVVLGYVVKMQIKGVWLGMLVGTLMQTLVLIVITCRTDWEKEVSIAQNRVKKWKIDPEMSDNGQEVEISRSQPCN